MHKPSEGMRRLGITLGAVASISWATFVLFASDGFHNMKPAGWAFFVIGIAVAFFLAFAAVWSIDWVLAGFRQGARK